MPLDRIPTFILIHNITEMESIGNQEEVNKYAMELARRIYIPNDEITFEQMLSNFGYVELNKEEEKGKVLKLTRKL